jgi:hypothetical protein
MCERVILYRLLNIIHADVMLGECSRVRFRLKV